MQSKEAVRLIVALMQGNDDIVILVDGITYDIAAIARGSIAGSEETGVIITVAANDDEEGDDDEYIDDDDEDDDNEDGISPDLAGRYIALGV